MQFQWKVFQSRWVFQVEGTFIRIYPQALRQSNMACWKCTIDDFPWKPSFIGDFPLPCLIPGGKRHEGKHGMPRPRKTACWVAPRMGKPTQKQQRTTTFLGEMIWSSKPLDLGFSILSSLCWGFYRTHVFSPWNLGVFPGFPHVFGPPSACPSLQHREAQHFRLCMQLQ